MNADGTVKAQTRLTNGEGGVPADFITSEDARGWPRRSGRSRRRPAPSFRPQ